MSDSMLQALPPDLRRAIEYDMQNSMEQPSDFSAIPVLLLLPCFIIGFYILGEMGVLSDRKNRTKGKVYRLKQSAHLYVYEGNQLNLEEEEVETILLKRFPYFIGLNSNLKELFIERLMVFIRSKVFLIRTDEVYREMFILTGAAAIQLTFGLKKYLLPHYSFIQVYKEEYFADSQDLRVLAGHVFDDTITIAWNHFLEGFLVHDNGVNVGLHEMAHALYYQQVIARRPHETIQFKAAFEKLELASERHFLQSGCKHNLYKKNAFKDLQEFWAESVEIFFEIPEQLHQCYPDVFNHLVAVMQQDPSDRLDPLRSQQKAFI